MNKAMVGGNSNALSMFSFHLRGSRSRLGREIVNCLVSLLPNSHYVDSTRFGGSFAELNSSRAKLGDVLIFASGKTTNRSTIFECEMEFKSFQSLLREIEVVFSVTRPLCIVYISTGGAIYGSSSETKYESSNINPSTPYALQKMNEEGEITNLSLRLGAKLLILRLANAYSAKTESPKSIVDLLLAATPGVSPIELYVNPNSRKQYGHFEDYAYVIIQTIIDFYFDNSFFRVQNIFPPHVYSVSDIIELVSLARNVNIDEICIIGDSHSRLPDDSVMLGSVYSRQDLLIRWRSLEELISTHYR